MTIASMVARIAPYMEGFVIVEDFNVVLRTRPHYPDSPHLDDCVVMMMMIK